MAAGTVLLVDDDASVLLTTRAILELDGHRVTTAGSGAEALALLGQRSFDVVVCDLRVGDADGLAVVGAARRREPDTAAILLTGHATLDVAIRALQGGLDDLLTKPCDVDHLRRVVARGVERRQFSRSSLSLLAEAGRMLASSLEYEATLRRVARLALPAFADWCQVDLVDLVDEPAAGAPTGRSESSTGGSSDAGAQGGVHAQSNVPAAPGYRTVATAHILPDKEALAEELRRRYPPDPTKRHGIWHVLRTGESVLVPDVAPLQEQDARDARHLELMRRLGTRSLVRVPLRAQGRLLGVLSFGLERPNRAFDEADLLLAQELASRAALAVENARLYEAEQRARREAEAALRAREAFLSAAAHELKTPVTGLWGTAQLLLRRLDGQTGVPPDWLRRALHTIGEQSARLTRLVNQLLEATQLDARRLALAPAEADLVRLVRHAVRAAQAATVRHSITVDAPPALPALVDAHRLLSVLANLLDNAIRFSPAGGDVAVTVRSSPDGFVELAVRDHGVGIPAARRAEIFDRFSRAEHAPHVEGMGLGLYVSKQIVELHGGSIHAENPPNGGTRMVVRLPARAGGIST